MAVVRSEGKPSLFVTMTANPNWKEIRAELLPGQVANDRPDIVARVFAGKLKQLRSDLLQGEWFGKALALIDVAEWQKRGLPHAHMLLTLADTGKLRTTDDYDSVVQAFLPDPIEHPRLFAAVEKYMMHGPCGLHNPKCGCMDNGRCSKHFPKDFSEETAKNVDGYPMYRRWV